MPLEVVSIEKHIYFSLKRYANANNLYCLSEDKINFVHNFHFNFEQIFKCVMGRRKIVTKSSVVYFIYPKKPVIDDLPYIDLQIYNPLSLLYFQFKLDEASALFNQDYNGKYTRYEEVS